MTETTTGRRTIRRFAHELYPEQHDWETAPLSAEVPRLYARMVGLSMTETGAFDDDSELGRVRMMARTIEYLDAVRIAALADALLQGMTDDEAWAWADQVHGDVDGHEEAYERAEHYGVPIDRIKPYLCGDEPTWHYHSEERRPDHVARVDGRESECLHCTEPDDTPIEPIVIPPALVRHRLEAGVFICEGGARSECHVYPDCDCDRWEPEEGTDKHRHPSAPHATCWMLPWLNGSDPRETQLEDGAIDFGELLDGEVLLEFDGDGVSWRYGTIGAAA